MELIRPKLVCLLLKWSAVKTVIRDIMFIRIAKLLYIIAIIAWAGNGSVAYANSAPTILPVGDQYVTEGQTLRLHITATDIDHDKISLGVSGQPTGAIFVDSGNGAASLIWRPDYAGPMSSEGSPFALSFWAGDGTQATVLTANIYVINSNRRPLIDAPTVISAVAGNPISFNLSASDPDHDALNWSVTGKPAGSIFTAGEPAQFSWATVFADSGSYTAGFIASDIYGASDTVQVTFHIAPAVIYALTIDTVSGYSGDLVTEHIRLSNLVPIRGFDLLINYDQSALSLASLTKTGTRAAGFEYFNYYLNERGISGDVHVVGIADIANSIVTPPLAAGDGPIISATFYITRDLNFAGFAVPINFAFEDLAYRTDNTLTDTAGARIEQTAIEYIDGFVAIKKVTQSALGDINLNGLAFEIGDAIYLTNYFINPVNSPLNNEQRANSDVNQDGLPASIADLVYLINRIVNLSAGLKPRYDHEKVALLSGDKRNEFSVAFDSPEEIGAAVMTLELKGTENDNITVEAPPESRGMLCKWRREGSLLRILIYSDKGNRLPAGINEVVKVTGAEARIKDIQVSSADGTMMPIVFRDGSEEILPRGFSLYQNFPNPFNPTTDISFDLPVTARVELTVYDLLGRNVKVLADGVFPAGHHTLVWDGRDEKGNSAASGIYFYQIKAADFTARKKMILLK
ncbi:hypothetical protein TRIP_C10003 [Candidatus Zixiibacteriota bacterium]|nr:hypothetical protein TRIP_C10003 [candidate division Zixibacteria bacterium]